MRAARGYTLIEMLACLAILSTIVVLTASLHTEALRTIARMGEAARISPQPLAARQIRLDAESARAVVGPAGEWSEGMLELTGAGSGRVRYERLRGDLVRVDSEESGIERRRTIAHGVLSWRWKSMAPALLTVEFAARSAPDPFLPLPAVALKPKPAAPEKVSIVVALRATHGRTGW